MNLLDKEGPIHDVTWSPSSKQFGVVYGYMPAKTTIFDQRANVVHTFNLGPRNTILFSPHGRFVLVAGFGNLAGQMDIYDLEKDYQKITTIEASNASVCEWSPDGKHILTATTSPRLRVDNGLRVWHVTGGLMYNEDMNELYTITWRPQSTDKFPLERNIGPAPQPHPSALAYLGTKKTPSKPVGAYRPPGARGTITPLAFRREDEGGAAYVNGGISSTSGNSGVLGFGRPKTRYVPGAEAVEPEHPPGAAPGGGVSLVPGAEPVAVVAADENLSKAALKNKKKREAKKAAAAAAGESAENGTAPVPAQPVPAPQSNGKLAPAAADNRSSSQRREPSRTRQPKTLQPPPGLGPRSTQQQQLPQTPRAAPTPATAAVAPPEPELSSPNNQGSPHERKVRALTKKLRAIDELRMRQAGGEKLELSQLSKIKTEDQVRKELDGLGGEL
jgi:translation initiation factor 2A